MQPATSTMIVYGNLLFGVCMASFAIGGFDPKAKHGAIMGAVGDVAMLVLAAGNHFGGEAASWVCSALAQALMLLFLAVFALQGYKSIGDPQKSDRLLTFGLLALISANCLRMLRGNLAAAAKQAALEERDKGK